MFLSESYLPLTFMLERFNVVLVSLPLIPRELNTLSLCNRCISSARFDSVSAFPEWFTRLINAFFVLLKVLMDGRGFGESDFGRVA
jgi:hypothetical protein